jgi:hypothetical protein
MTKYLLFVVWVGVMIYPFPLYSIYWFTILIILIAFIAWFFLYGLDFLQKLKLINKNLAKWVSKNFSSKSLDQKVNVEFSSAFICFLISSKICFLAFHCWEELDTLLLIASFIGSLPIITPLILSIFFTFKYWGEDDD